MSKSYEQFRKNLQEGTLSVPTTKAKWNNLQKIMTKKLPVGDEGTKDSADTLLHRFLDDDNLSGTLRSLRKKKGPNADARPAILQWLKRNGFDIKKRDGYKDSDWTKNEEVEIREGTWAIPTTKAKWTKLQKLMKTKLPVGDEESDDPKIEKQTASSKLYNLVGDDELFDDLYTLSKKKGPKADARLVVLKWLKKNDFDIKKKDGHKGQGWSTPGTGYGPGGPRKEEVEDGTIGEGKRIDKLKGRLSKIGTGHLGSTLAKDHKFKLPKTRLLAKKLEPLDAGDLELLYNMEEVEYIDEAPRPKTAKQVARRERMLKYTQSGQRDKDRAAKAKKIAARTAKETREKNRKLRASGKKAWEEEVEVDESEAPSSTVGGVGGGMVGEPPGPTKKKKKKYEIFAGDCVFEVSSDTFMKCKGEKPKYARYIKHIGDDEDGQIVREYGLRNPSKGIVIKDGTYGAMMYLRRRKS